MKRTSCLLLLAMLMIGILSHAQQFITKESFNTINLNYPGLEKVKARVVASDYPAAAAALLSYYKKKSKEPDFSAAEEEIELNQPVDKATRAAADSALAHKFRPHKGYGFFSYGKNINWQYWPVKDNEVRWQLHRVKWWQSMALVYRSTKDERYAREWIFQFTDWARKNPLGFSKDNDKYAWRPLEVSDRILNLAPSFNIFVHSPNFTPAFLMEFLNNYHQQADYLSTNYAERGNHRLFEAQRVLFAGVSFPEFKGAAAWRDGGVMILNDEIKKQVYPDGVQWELSPNYHIAMINTFLSALRSAQKTDMEQLFPSSYKETVEKMILATINFSFPDYTYPVFGDAKLVEKSSMLKSYANWAKAFPHNEVIQYYATDGRKGKQPSYLSHGLTTSGFYTFRSGWNTDATAMVIKAGPPAEFHAQPDNGTFELWVKSRNFTPDAGCYVYSGDEEINRQRDWYRQTRVHSTLTLNNSNMVITNAHLDKWETALPTRKGNDEATAEILTYTNPSYKDLNHQRSILFIDQKYFLLIDKAIGTATGAVGTHFQLKEGSNPVFDKNAHSVYTTFADGNNLLIQNFNTDKITLSEEEGKVSYVYKQEIKRPAFVFEKNKNDDKTQVFVTLLYPFEGLKPPTVTITENKEHSFENGKISLTINNNGKRCTVKMNLY